MVEVNSNLEIQLDQFLATKTRHKNKRQFPVDNSTWFMNIYKLGLAELMAVVDGQTRKQTSSVSNNKSVSFSLTKSSHWILFLE
jgi:hypothetical protein